MSSHSPDPALDRALTATQEALEIELLLEWLAEHAMTPLGTAALMALLGEQDPLAADARRVLGEEALRAVTAEEAPSLAGVVALEDLAQAARQRVLEGEELQALAASLERVQELVRWARKQVHFPALSARLIELPNQTALAEEIRRCIEPRGRVRDEADPALAQLREQIRKLEKQRQQRLDEVAEKLFEQGLLRQRQPVQRDGRLLLAVRATSSGRARGVVHATSQSGDTAFVEPGAVLELSNRIVESRFRERRLEEEVLRRLGLEVLRATPDLQEIDRAMTAVDVAFASAHWARQQDAHFPSCPPLPQGLRFDRARHPLLQRQMGKEVVPLDLRLGDHEDLLVVTGPNTGGKTLVLKTVGLLAWMANRGLPVTAAEGSAVPHLRAIVADVGDAQSVADNLSTFSGHLVRLQDILAVAGAGVLILLDELGTGTDPEEGAALGQAVLEALANSGGWTIANTHLGSLKLFSLNLERAENASMEFDPMSLAPKYRLLVGVPGASHAIEVAERLGLTEDLLARARQLVSRGDQTEHLLADVGRVRREAEVMRVEAGETERQLAQRERDLAATEGEILARAKLRENEAELAFREHYAMVRQWSEQAAKGIGARLPGQSREAFQQQLEQLHAILDEEPLQRRWLAFIKGLRKGDRIKVPRLGATVVVKKVDKKRERVRVQYEGMDLELPFHDLSWAAAPELD